MLVVTNLVLPVLPVLPKVTNKCYRTTHAIRQRLHFASRFLAFCMLVVTNLAGIASLNVRLRKLPAPSETAHLSHSCLAARRPFGGVNPAVQPPRRGLFRLATVAVPTPTCKGPRKPVSAQKKEGENEQ